MLIFGCPDLGLRERCEAAGAAAVLTKPFDYPLLIAALEQAISSAPESH
jgi:CheY-like chemotaxis protein